MFDHFKLTPTGKGWAIIARKGAGAATDTAWVSLGGCPRRMVALRVYKAAKALGGR